MITIVTNVLYYPEENDFIRRYDNHEWLRFTGEEAFIAYVRSFEFEMDSLKERWKIYNCDFMPVILNAQGITQFLPLESVMVKTLFEENNITLLYK